ncbi:MAG: spore photoproduct lyase [Firmicutes bacterium]|nr:spore photoproduct lyase [Bacillota bacterium]
MWQPKRVLFEEKALDYEYGRRMYDKFTALKIPVEIMGKGNRISGIPDSPAAKAWSEAKNVLAVRMRNTKTFETCKPSAHYQLPLVSSCPGKCEYCYLHTSLGKKPYLRAYANIDEILSRAEQYIVERQPEVTVFEGAATSDPIPLEPFTGLLARAIQFFADRTDARFRFVTKFTQVESLLSLKHNNRTRFRFSLNSHKVIQAWEHGTPDLGSRLNALAQVAEAGYPLGVIIAPVVLTPGWQGEYLQLLQELAMRLRDQHDLTIEIILHRFTQRAKNNIMDIFPDSTLPMEKEDRTFKYGQFGYGKYVYPKDVYSVARDFFATEVARLLPEAKLEYLV